MPALDLQTRHALSRARWAVLQTGMITSAIALFGVYVLGCRDLKSLPMHWYAYRWIAVGPLIIGGVCASGYAIGAYWTGLRIRGWLFVAVLALQLFSFVAAHYAQFTTSQLIWRDTQEPVPLTEYARYVILHMGGDFEHPLPAPRVAYSMFILQILQFSLVAILSPLMLIRHPRCRICGGALHQRRIGSITSTNEIPRLTHFATLSDAGPLKSLLQTRDFPSPNELTVTLTRCVICHQGQLIAATDVRTPIDISRKLVQVFWAVQTS